MIDIPNNSLMQLSDWWKDKTGFIKQVDKGWITTVKDLESWRFECSPFVIHSDKGLTLKMSAF